MDYRTGSHTKYKLEYHFVWVTKYRYPVLQGELALRLRELVCQTCHQFEIEIIRGVVSKDHVHVLMSAPPTMSPSEIMRRIKGRTSAKLFEEFPQVKKRYWGRHFWARGYLRKRSIQTSRLKDKPALAGVWRDFQSLESTHRL